MLGVPPHLIGRAGYGLGVVLVVVAVARLLGPGDPDAFVVTVPQGGPLRVIAFRARVWRPATRKANLDRLRIHDLRHTAVALWIAAGAGPKEVATRAGHTSVSFTFDRYGHLYPEADTALRDRLDALYVAGALVEPGVVIELRRDSSRPQRGPERGERRVVVATCGGWSILAGELGGCRTADDRCCPLRSGRSWPGCGPAVARRSYGRMRPPGVHCRQLRSR